MTTRSSPKLKVEQAAPTPTEELVKEATKSEVITDDKGRKILMRKPGVLAQYRIVDAVGPDSAANETYMSMVVPLTWVGAIDDDPVACPQTKREVEALIMRLDDEGLKAAMLWFMEHVAGPAMEGIDQAEQRARLKN